MQTGRRSNPTFPVVDSWIGVLRGSGDVTPGMGELHLGIRIDHDGRRRVHPLARETKQLNLTYSTASRR